MFDPASGGGVPQAPVFRLSKRPTSSFTVRGNIFPATLLGGLVRNITRLRFWRRAPQGRCLPAIENVLQMAGIECIFY